ncbi:MAG: hypothetical protein OWQ51_01800 [Pyrobaculum arsenaticum]|uniref:Uncharacterized protein n=1 Tax=Pyrobaculum arsenaticum TaxID=121277 RepID=A0A7L4P901_9CREN|nr:hypothetical protein [Pyrobaculum arsenaticum]MCY0889710.1 hypothetical protein [Pyrobaculum arsenaticum]NYR14917.1 hypothetical protein [Pyrobaculum arsenaticum]
MRLVVLIAIAVTAAFLLDYVHVRVMCPLCPFPSPMLPVFALLVILTAAVFYFFFTFKPVKTQPQGLPLVISNLLREPERSIYIKIYEKGGEAYLSEVAKELGLRKLRAWRAAQRLAEKNLVVLEKKSGRLVVRLRPLEELSIQPIHRQNYKQ